MRTESAALARVHERQQVHLSTKEFCLQSSPIGLGSKWFPQREHLDRLISQCDYQFRLCLIELRPQLVRSGIRQCGEGAAPRRKMSRGKPQLVVSCMHAFQGIELSLVCQIGVLQVCEPTILALQTQWSEVAFVKSDTGGTIEVPARIYELSNSLGQCFGDSRDPLDGILTASKRLWLVVDG